jgi:hypothetical protein
MTEGKSGLGDGHYRQHHQEPAKGFDSEQGPLRIESMALDLRGGAAILVSEPSFKCTSRKP